MERQNEYTSHRQNDIETYSSRTYCKRRQNDIETYSLRAYCKRRQNDIETYSSRTYFIQRQNDINSSDGIPDGPDDRPRTQPIFSMSSRNMSLCHSV